MSKHYQCTVGFETDKIDKATGDVKVKKTKFLVEDNTLEGALNAMAAYLKGDSRGYEILAITPATYEDIIGVKTKVSVLR